MITAHDYFMGRDLKYPEELTEELRRNASVTVGRVNRLLDEFGEDRHVNSGWRPKAVNAAVPNAAKTSKHTTCEACDISDDDGSLDAWCLAHQDKLAEIGLWLESPASTPRWAHVQIVPPRSGNRVFLP